MWVRHEECMWIGTGTRLAGWLASRRGRLAEKQTCRKPPETPLPVKVVTSILPNFDFADARVAFNRSSAADRQPRHVHVKGECQRQTLCLFTAYIDRTQYTHSTTRHDWRHSVL